MAGEDVAAEVAVGSRQTVWMWLASRWVLSYSITSREPWIR
jgi:hypothetical protein